ncbi:hypothetical protein [Amycolatopsis pigmentata]|uniref:Uncharacterized protein n=1 Tax=Amycolatopsis pigmentata TaxID=450801 RepID=A0ABW5G4J3_9PSEU
MNEQNSWPGSENGDPLGPVVLSEAVTRGTRHGALTGTAPRIDALTIMWPDSPSLVISYWEGTD